MIDHVNPFTGPRIIAAPRRGGKTTTLVEWAREDPEKRLIVTHSVAEADRLKREYQVAAVGPDNARQDIQSVWAGRSAQFAVDNLVETLGFFLGRRPQVVTLDDEGAIDESAEIILLRERDAFQKGEIAKLHQTINILIEMAGLTCHCDYMNGPEQDCPFHGDKYAVIDPANPTSEQLAHIAQGLQLETMKETVQ